MGLECERISPAEELQTCTTSTGCQEGEAGPGAGQFASTCGPQAVAVDNDPLSASYKDVYVVDYCHDRVQKFDSSGNFLLMFGGHVNETTGGDVCMAGEACTRHAKALGTANSNGLSSESNIAVGPGGAVYVGDKARVQVFEPSGAWRESISLTGLSSYGQGDGAGGRLGWRHVRDGRRSVLVCTSSNRTALKRRRSSMQRSDIDRSDHGGLVG